MTDATITVEDIQSTGKKIKLVKFSGQLDESNIDDKIKTVYQLLEENPQLNLLFDFEMLAYMNSKSIGYLTDIYGKITETGGQVVIAKAQANISDILHVVGLTQLIKCVDTLEEAKTYIESNTAATAIASGDTAQPVAQAQAQTKPEGPPAPAASQPAEAQITTQQEKSPTQTPAPQAASASAPPVAPAPSASAPPVAPPPTPTEAPAPAPTATPTPAPTPAPTPSTPQPNQEPPQA